MTIPSYGVVQCLTLAATIADTTVQLSVNGSAYTCQGLTGACDYQTSALMPVVSTVVKQDAYTLIFTGVGFTFPGFPAEVSFIGINADTVTVDSDTQVTATYTKGVPLSQTLQTPVLSFKDDTSSTTHWAVSTIKLSNPFT